MRGRSSEYYVEGDVHLRQRHAAWAIGRLSDAVGARPTVDLLHLATITICLILDDRSTVLFDLRPRDRDHRPYGRNRGIEHARVNLCLQRLAQPGEVSTTDEVNDASGADHGVQLSEARLEIDRRDVDDGHIPAGLGDVVDRDMTTVSERHDRNIHLRVRGVGPRLAKVLLDVHPFRRGFRLDQPKTMKKDGWQIIHFETPMTQQPDRVSQL